MTAPRFRTSSQNLCGGGSGAFRAFSPFSTASICSHGMKTEFPTFTGVKMPRRTQLRMVLGARPKMSAVSLTVHIRGVCGCCCATSCIRFLLRCRGSSGPPFGAERCASSTLAKCPCQLDQLIGRAVCLFNRGLGDPPENLPAGFRQPLAGWNWSRAWVDGHSRKMAADLVSVTRDFFRRTMEFCSLQTHAAGWQQPRLIYEDRLILAASLLHPSGNRVSSQLSDSIQFVLEVTQPRIRPMLS